MKVSIVVPIYNVESALKYCLDSIKNQDYTDYEVIMINDGSTDNSPRIAQKFTVEDPKFKLYSTPNRGLASARNEGLKYITGDIVVFVDSDDQIAPNLLSIITREFIENPQVNLIHFTHTEVTESVTSVKNSKIKAKKVVDRKSALKSLLESEIISTAWANSVRTKIIQNNNITFSDGKLFEDENFNTKLFVYAKNIMFLDLDKGPYYYLVGRSGSIMNSVFTNKTIKHFKDRLFIINDQYNFLSTHSCLSADYISTWYLYKLIWLYNNYNLVLGKNLFTDFQNLKNKIINLYKKNSKNLTYRQKLQYFRVKNKNFNKLMIVAKNLAAIHRKKVKKS